MNKTVGLLLSSLVLIYISQLTGSHPKLLVSSDFRVQPYLQFATQSCITILWETENAGSSCVEYGESIPLSQSISLKGFRNLHEIRIEGLRPQSNYFYQARSEDADGCIIESELLTFQTAVKDENAFTFGVISDTQNNPGVWGQIAERLFAERPHFAVHAGDIVGHGNEKAEWVNEFLGPGHVLMGRVPVYAILGNHEDDASHYYSYLAAPQPEHRYSFKYGNAQFFMIDTGRDVAPGSEQHSWLEEALRTSDAQWKFAVHHHPPYTSDEDDYGDTWKEPSKRGDPRLKPLIELYEKYNLDICFFGHIHGYERSWPLRNEMVDPENGVRYIQTGGGGGSLEDYAPTRSWFTAKVHRSHNFILISVHGNHLQLQAIDNKGIVFDTLQENK